jgi:hypothetical protein
MAQVPEATCEEFDLVAGGIERETVSPGPLPRDQLERPRSAARNLWHDPEMRPVPFGAWAYPSRGCERVASVSPASRRPSSQSSSSAARTGRDMK